MTSKRVSQRSDDVRQCAICGIPFHPLKYEPGLCCSRVCAGLLRRQKPLEDRFWTKVDVRSPEECWLWQGSINDDGYGAFWVADRIRLAHRISWTLANKRPIPDGLNILHKCDVRACCNPNHFFLGDHADNRRDCTEKQRTAKGENHGRALLTEDQAREILIRNKAGESQRILAAAYGVSRSSIKHLLKGRNWKSLHESLSGSSVNGPACRPRRSPGNRSPITICR